MLCVRLRGEGFLSLGEARGAVSAFSDKVRVVFIIAIVLSEAYRRELWLARLQSVSNLKRGELHADLTQSGVEPAWSFDPSPNVGRRW
jgi:hypothetical protein